jgi:single-stranded-DNA-specific exonuclease
MKKYALRDPIPEDIDKLFLSYSPLVRSLLYARGIRNLDEAIAFLNPDYEKHLHDPFLLKNMDKAVERILKAIKKKELVVIYSDYDADGIPGAVALHDFFKKIGYTNFINYIPLRNEEGFGLNKEAIKTLSDQKAKIIITIDCGITDVDEVELASKEKIDVIITDHHLPGKKLPKAFAVINPKQEKCLYPDKMICGSGVIFKLIQGLIKKGKETEVFEFGEGQEKWLLDMIGLATLSDMVPLRGENRVFSYYGVRVLQKSPRVGLMKLLSLLKINQHTLTEDDVSFMITPRINAASRMGIPKDAFTLMSTDDEILAGQLALHLNKKNEERKGVVGSMVREVKKRIEDRGEDMRHVLVFGNPEWKPSLLGLVANSFSDEHNRPTFFWGREGVNGTSVIKGSCRSGDGTDVVELMEKVKDILLEYGGHKGAGGFSVSEENIHFLEDRLNEAYIKLKKDKILEDILVDKKLSIDDVNWDTWQTIEKFAPFGFENPKPLFLFENIEIFNTKLFGKESNHLELKFKNGKGKDVTAIAFFQNGEKFSVPVKLGNKINLVATLEKSQFRNFPELRLRIVDIF